MKRCPMVVRMRHAILSALAIAGALAAGAERAAEATAGDVRPPIPLAACGAAGAPVAAMPKNQTSLAARLAGQVRHYPRPNLTFSASTTVEGEVQIEASGGDFGFRKRVQSNGAYTLDLQLAADTVTLRFT